MRRLQLSLVLVVLAGGPGCTCREREGGSGPAGSDPAKAASQAGAASEPDLPEPLALDCDRILPEAMRAAQFPGFGVQPVIEGPIATCLLEAPDGAVRPSVSLFCHRRKRNWNFADEMARDPRKKAIQGLGRAAYSKNDHVFFYPSRLDCLARVIWPGDPTRGAAIGRILDAHLAKSTVSQTPVP